MNQANYTINKEGFLGKGQFGTVYECIRESNGQSNDICVKIIENKGNDEKVIKREMEIMNLLKNTENLNLIKIYDIQYSSKEINIYMEKCAQGDLSEQFKKKRKDNNWYKVDETINVTKQLINGYKDLLKLNIIHRDIKPANILIDDNGTVKVQ